MKMEPLRNRPIWLNYAVAIVLIAVASAIQIWPQQLPARLFYPMFYPAVVLAALYGGLAAGLPATLLACLLLIFWHPSGQSFMQDGADWPGLLIFAITCTVISFISEAMRRSRQREARGRQLADASSQALRQSEHRMQLVLDNMPALVAYWNSDLRNEFGNKISEKWFGISPENMRGRHMREVLGEKLYALSEPYIQQALQGKPQTFERAIKDVAGVDHNTEASYIPNIVGGKVQGIFVFVTDITQRRKMEQELRVSEERFRSALENAPIGMALLSPDGKFMKVNRALCDIVGYEPDELLKLSIAAITHPDDIEQDLDFIRRMEAGEVSLYEIEKRYIRKDGQSVWVQLASSLVRDESGAPMLIIKQVQNITKRKELEQQLEAQAHTDYLTGVANRGYFLELAEQELIRAQRYGSPLSIAMLDLDHFKVVNDTYGHQAGDKVLQELSRICCQMLREVDVIGRVGGEEFAILLPETSSDKALDVVERLREAIAAAEVPLAHGLPLHFTASIGIASFTAADANIDMLLHRADQALYQAKRTGRNRTCVA